MIDARSALARVVARQRNASLDASSATPDAESKPTAKQDDKQPGKMAAVPVQPDNKTSAHSRKPEKAVDVAASLPPKAEKAPLETREKPRHAERHETRKPVRVRAHQDKKSPAHIVERKKSARAIARNKPVHVTENNKYYVAPERPHKRPADAAAPRRTDTRFTEIWTKGKRR
jgi:hypothetical protein